MKLILSIMAIIFASNAAVAEIKCSKELKVEANRVRQMMIQQNSQGSKQIEIAFSTDSVASSLEKGKLSKVVYEKNFKGFIDEEILKTEKLVQSTLKKLEKQGDSSKVCKNRTLIRQIGQENLDAYMQIWNVKLYIVEEITRNDGELSDEVLSKISSKLKKSL